MTATTDISEKALESQIVREMTGRVDLLSPPHAASETSTPTAGGTGWLLGDPKHYDREYCVDLAQLRGFIEATQPKLVEALALATDGPTRRQFLARLSQEVGRRGVIDVLRKGIEHRAHHVDLFYGTPSAGNAKAAERFTHNRFSVTRQLAYSLDETRRALDLGLFVNGLPVATFELKNKLTRQNVEDAVSQYKRDRLPTEPLFAFGRCVVHFAVDDREVRFCTELKGKASWFLPFNRGHDDGAGNPPTNDGVRTTYLWREELKPAALTNILENYAQIVDEPDRRTGKKRRKQIFPRYHQLDVVRSLLSDATLNGPGRRYLIQHSAGSGKSNSIAWLAHQLTALSGPNGQPLFGTVVVITDRRILDEQIRENIKQFTQVSAVVGAVTGSGGSKTRELTRFLDAGKRIVISTVQTFPALVKDIEETYGNRTFAIIIDEAHSSQGGKTAAAVNKALGNADAEGDDSTDPEDIVNATLEKRIASRRLLKNASYFAFTATPKHKTLEMFGDPQPPDAEGKVQHRPFRTYSMKQAVQEEFILDVLKHFTPVKTYLRLVKTIESDPEFEVRKARKKLRRYIESHDKAIGEKAVVMLDHFQDAVIAPGKLGGKARAMVVTSGIERAVQYFRAFQSLLEARESPHRAIVAFSGEHDFGDGKVTETSLNGFPSSEIPDRIQEDPYRFLICADKFQTGYDEPLLHTMYVDKGLSGIKAVQTLSRLNRAHPDKREVFVLDFQNDTESITKAFQDYFRTTVLSEETDPNKLNDLLHDIEAAQVYSPEQAALIVERFLSGAPREALDPLLEACVETYEKTLDVDAQIKFKGNARAFTRTYEFLGAVMAHGKPAWERASIVLNLLLLKLPKIEDEDLAQGILEQVDMDKYRAERLKVEKLTLADQDSLIDPVPVGEGGGRPDPKFDRLSNLLEEFNLRFGGKFKDGSRIAKRLQDDIAPKVAADPALQNARQNTPQTARLQLVHTLNRVMLDLIKDDTEVYKQFVQDPAFKHLVTEMIDVLTRP